MDSLSLLNMAHLVRWFTYETWWFSIGCFSLCLPEGNLWKAPFLIGKWVMGHFHSKPLVYQKVARISSERYPYMEAPKNGWFIHFILEHPTKMDDGGESPHFRKPLYGCVWKCGLWSTAILPTKIWRENDCQPVDRIVVPTFSDKPVSNLPDNVVMYHHLLYINLPSCTDWLEKMFTKSERVVFGHGQGFNQ